MLTRLIHYLKTKMITTLFTDLSRGSPSTEYTQIGVSSIMDTWICLEQVKIGGERNRTLHIAKSRGMQHSNQVREFIMTDRGVELVDVYLGPSGVITGSARAALEAREVVDEERRRRETDRIQARIVQRKRLLEARIALLQEEYLAEEAQLQESMVEAEEETQYAAGLRDTMAKLRESK